MELKQGLAFLGVLAFLGTFAAMAVTLVTVVCVKLVGEKRLAQYLSIGSNWLFGGRGLTLKIAVAALVILLGYSATLFGASLASHEWTLPPGSEKYFCEVDCHLAYAVMGVETAGTIGSGASAVKAQGNFTIISVRTRFDERTTSPHRGNAPLTPSPRELWVVDDAGRSFPVSQAGQQALTDSSQAGESLMQPLRPGESYISKVVFDLPPDAHNPKLLIESPINPHWIGEVLIGDENSVLHNKVFLALPAGVAK